jgi:hypothetical protein
MREVRLVLVVGALAGVAVVGFVLSRAPATVARVSTAVHEPVETTRQRVVACQPDEVLPRGTTAIRLRLFAFLGPRVTVDVLAQGRVIAHGEHGSGWTGGVVTVPVHPLPVTVSGAEVCFTLALNGDEAGELVGEKTTAGRAARGSDGSLPGRVRLEYLRPGSSSWWSLALSVARRMGLGHAWGGTWIAVLVLVLMGGVALLCARLVLRELE